MFEPRKYIRFKSPVTGMYISPSHREAFPCREDYVLATSHVGGKTDFLNECGVVQYGTASLGVVCAVST